MYCTPFPSINPSSATYLFIAFFRSLPRAHGNRWSSFLSVTSPCPKMFILGLVCYLCRMIKVCRLVQRSYKGQSTCGPATHCWTWLWPAWHCNPQLPKLASKPTFFFFFKQDFSSKTCRCFGRGKVGQLCVSKVKKKKRATLLFILSWIQGRDEYEVKFSCQACFGLISTFLWKSYILCLYPSVTD